VKDRERHSRVARRCQWTEVIRLFSLHNSITGVYSHTSVLWCSSLLQLRCENARYAMRPYLLENATILVLTLIRYWSQ